MCKLILLDHKISEKLWRSRFQANFRLSIDVYLHVIRKRLSDTSSNISEKPITCTLYIIQLLELPSFYGHYTPFLKDETNTDLFMLYCVEKALGAVYCIL